MKRRPLFLSLACTGLMAVLADVSYAHGGQYRGPEDVVPPPGSRGGGNGPTGPTTGSGPRPTGPRVPGPAPVGGTNPTTGGNNPSGGGRGPVTGRKPIGIVDDQTGWEYWWEFNKDPFIRLREAIHGGDVQTGSIEYYLGVRQGVGSRDLLRPSENLILQRVLPALKQAIDSTDQRDITSSCMVAMAKIGKDHPDFKLLKDVFLPRLQSRDQEIREVAALAIGIAAIAEDDNVTTLVELARDSFAGRRLSDRSEVDDRTRSFATYGLGLVAYATSNVGVKQRVFEVLRDLLADRRSSSRNLRVAVLNAMGLLHIGSQTDEEQALLADTLEVLEGYWMRESGAGEQLIQAHCPWAIAKLIGRDHPRTAHFREVFAKDLAGVGDVKRVNDHIFQSCALALGQLCRPFEDDTSEDVRYSKLLLEQYHNAKDHQTRYFALLALGQIGGARNREVLLKAFETGSKALEKPWAALALGVRAFEEREALAALDKPAPADPLVGDRLHRALTSNRNPQTVSAVAIALGLMQYQDAAPDMRRLMVASSHQSDLCGYLAIGLALMGDRRSIDDIRDIVQKSVRRPELLKQAAIALGKLGDKTVADELQKLLKDGDQNLAKLSAIASALGFIGDHRTIDPLRSVLFDTSLTPLSRAFAAVALGGVADKEPLPWNSKIGVDMNYRAAVETLVGSATGILDIL